jgi:hypothetical protein
MPLKGRDAVVVRGKSLQQCQHGWNVFIMFSGLYLMYALAVYAISIAVGGLETLFLLRGFALACLISA